MSLSRVASATNLSVCRIVFFGWLYVVGGERNFTQWGAIPGELATPVPIAGLIPLPVAGEETLAVLSVVWKLSLLFGLLGLFRRTVMGVSALLGLYLLSLSAAFGKSSHDVLLPVLLLFIFWIARSTDRFSIDAWWRRRRGEPDPEPSVEYHWPIMLGRWLLALAFFAAGIAKLRASGIDWITSDNLSNLLIRHHYSHVPRTNWGLWLSSQTTLCQLLAGLTVAVELFYPLALFVRRLRWLLVGGALSMQVGIWLLLGVNFRLFMVANVVWVDWEGLWLRFAPLLSKLRRRPPQAHAQPAERVTSDPRE